MDRETYDNYCEKFKQRDYDAVLGYWHESFECYVGDLLLFSNGPELKRTYGFLHDHVDEHIHVDRYLSDSDNLFMEARVRLICRKTITAAMLEREGLKGFFPMDAGLSLDIPQFIHYHLDSGKFKKAVCLVAGAPVPVV